MKFSRQATPVPRIRKNLGDEYLIPRDGLTILPTAGSSRISAGQKRSPTGGTDGALTISIIKGGSLTISLSK